MLDEAASCPKLGLNGVPLATLKSKTLDAVNVISKKEPMPHKSVPVVINKVGQTVRALSNFNLFFWNVQGICNKLDYLNLLCSKYNIDVLAIAEHWVKSLEVPFLCIPGYQTASCYCRPNKLHGGASIFVRNGIEYKELTYIRELSIEMVCEVAAIELIKEKVIVLSIYRPYNEEAVYFNNFLNCLYNVISLLFKPSFNLVISADFNVQFNCDNSFKRDLVNLFDCFGLVLTTFEITRPGLINQGTCIDNVVTDIHETKRSSKVIQTLLSDHNGILFNFKVNSTGGIKCDGNGPISKHFVRLINDCNVRMFISMLGDINWIDVYKISDIEGKYDKFHELLMWAVNGAFPLVTSQKKKVGSNNKWYNQELCKLKEQCDKLYDLGKIFDSQEIRNRYKLLRKKYRLAVKNAKVQYYSNLVLASKNKSKSMWQITNSLMNNNSKAEPLPIEVTSDNFNNFFVDNVNRVSDSIPLSINDSTTYVNKYPKPKTNFQFNQVSVEEMYKKINSISNSKCLDIYGINSFIIKLSSCFVSEVLTHIFNECLISGCIFPGKLKNIKVVPVHKKGDRKVENNYRPISLVPVISKVFEKLLHEQVSNHFENYKIFTEKQYGFRPKRNTCNAVVNLVHGVIDDLEKGSSVCFRSFDMSKAFDTVEHSILSKKLYHYGFNTDSVNLLMSYLTGRTQFVFKDGAFSNGRVVKFGVPQGSILGPILFNIYINDLPQNIESTGTAGFLFADDLGLKVSYGSQKVVNEKLDTSLALIQDWCAANNLSLNPDKINDIVFTYNRNATQSPNCDTLKFLGILLDSNLSWHSHIDLVSKKMAKGLYMLRRLKSTVGKNILLNIYFAQIQSILSYGIILWGSSNYCRKLFILQKRAIRIICSKSFLDSCVPLFIELGVLTVYSLYIFYSLIYVHSHIDDFKTNANFHSYNTRNKNSLRIQQYHYSTSQKNWFYSSTKLYNSLPTDIKLLPISKFKSKIKKVLIRECLYNFDDFFNIDWKH